MNTEATLSEKTEEAAAATVDQAQDVSSDAVEAAKETVESAVSSAEETIASTSDTMIDAVTAGQQQTLEAAESAAAAFAGYLGRARSEIAEFVTERIHQTLDTQQALLRCRNFDDFRAIQRDYVRTALDQYSTGAARILRVSTDAQAKAVERVDA